MTDPPNVLSILFVVDEDEALRVRRALLELGPGEPELVHARSAAEGRRLAGERRFDLVVVDSRIGEQDGLELVRQLRAAAVETAVLVLTDASGEELAVEVLRAGATDYLKKSGLGGDALRRSVRYALDMARQAELRQRAEAALRLREEQMRDAQRLETVATLSSGIAHEFNNLLNVVIGYADMMRRKLPAGDPLHRNVEQILHAGDKAAALTRQLLAFSRTQVLQPTVQDPAQLINDIAPVVRSVMGRRAEIVLEIDPQVGRITADRSQIEHALMNLVVNAKDAMPEGGRLTLEARNAEPDDVRALESDPSLPRGRYVMLAVSDTGTGMTAEVQSRALEPFFTTKGRANARGLGLSTVYGLVRQSNGLLRVESEPGRGTTVAIYLPLVDGAGKPETPAPREVRGASEVILLVDDDAAMRELLSESLRSAGYSVMAAASGSEALRQAAAKEQPIDLLLTDVMMPGMSGTELAARVRQLRPSARVVYMSGATRDALRQRDQTIDGPFLWKPFSTEELTHTVRQVLEAGRP